MFREDALPTLDEVEKNYYLLKPILKLHPTKKPSTFAIADSLLMHNRMTNGLLMRNVRAGERQEHALQEARWDAVQEGPRPKVPGKARGSQETGWACAGGGGGGLVCESAFGRKLVARARPPQADKLARIIGKLRRMFRQAETSPRPIVHELKQLLQRAPAKPRTPRISAQEII